MSALSYDDGAAPPRRHMTALRRYSELLNLSKDLVTALRRAGATSALVVAAFSRFAR